MPRIVSWTFESLCRYSVWCLAYYASRLLRHPMACPPPTRGEAGEAKLIRVGGELDKISKPMFCCNPPTRMLLRSLQPPREWEVEMSQTTSMQRKEETPAIGQNCKTSRLLATTVWMAAILETSFAQAQDNAVLATTGAELAKTHCSRCHVIDTKNVFGGISSSPSFPLLVNGLKDWEERMQSFHIRPPHPSIVRFKGETVDPNVAELRVPVILEYSDIDALVAYVRTLKKGE